MRKAALIEIKICWTQFQLTKLIKIGLLEFSAKEVSVLHVKLFCGNISCSQNWQRGISGAIVLNNIATYVQLRRGQCMVMHFQISAHSHYPLNWECYHEIPWSIDLMKFKGISAVHVLELGHITQFGRRFVL